LFYHPKQKSILEKSHIIYICINIMLTNMSNGDQQIENAVNNVNSFSDANDREAALLELQRLKHILEEDYLREQKSKEETSYGKLSQQPQESRSNTQT
jgi:hypothetical protein